MHDEKGYIQFRCDWERCEPSLGPAVEALAAWRNRLHALGLIGVYPDGIGYGNLSVRSADGTFLITGTATGGLQAIGTEHITEVVAYDITANWLRCRGPVQASSESLSHAAVYGSDPGIAAVIHVHHLGLWERLRGVLPTTDPAAEAGTPAMALAITELLRDPLTRRRGLFVMGGHREGLIAFGQSLDEAGAAICMAFESAPASPG
jgi:ribulose-5-phosphate 4-epimerase/fuculose-1-phosphate aldolase